MIYSFLAIPVLLLSAFLIPLAGIKKENFAPKCALLAAFITFVLSVATLPAVVKSKVLVMQMSGWKAPLGISIVADSFSIILIILVSFIGFLVALYSQKYITERKREYYSLLCLALAGMIGILHTGDLFNMFVFLEITSIASYALASYYRNAKSFEASIKYLIIGALGTSFFLLGTAFLYGAFGTLNLADLSMAIANTQSSVFPIATALVLAGLAIKTAIVPFHAWKPDVITSVPSPIGALFGAASTSVGLYAIFRIILTVLNLEGQLISTVIILAGIITMIVGAAMALQQKDILRLLAYSTISQAGYVLLAFGMGYFSAKGYEGAVFHLINLAIIDALLFFSAGVSVKLSRTSIMDDMKTISNPLVSYGFLVGALSLAGIPLLNGFSSKWLIYIAGLEVSPILTLIAIIVSAVTLAYSVKAFYLIFMKNEKVNIKIDNGTKFILAGLMAISIFFGIFPDTGIQIADFMIDSFDNSLYVLKVLG